MFRIHITSDVNTFELKSIYDRIAEYLNLKSEKTLKVKELEIKRETSRFPYISS